MSGTAGLALDGGVTGNEESVFFDQGPVDPNTIVTVGEPTRTIAAPDEAYELEGQRVEISTIKPDDVEAIASLQVKVVQKTRDLINEGINPKDGYFLWSAGETVQEAAQVISDNVDLERSLVITRTVGKTREVVGYLLVLPYENAVEAKYCSEEHRNKALVSYRREANNRRAELEDLVCGQIYLNKNLRGRKIKEVTDDSNGSAANFALSGTLTAVDDDGATSEKVAARLYQTHAYLNRKYPMGDVPDTAWVASVGRNNGRSNSFHVKKRDGGGFETVEHFEIDGEEPKILYKRDLPQD